MTSTETASASRPPRNALPETPREEAPPRERVLCLVSEARGDALAALLRSRGYEPQLTPSRSEAHRLATSLFFDAVLLSAEDGAVALCAELCALHPSLPVVILAPHGTMDGALEALRAGACDYLLEPVDASTLDRTLARAALRRQRLDGNPLREEPLAVLTPHLLTGESPAMTQLYELLTRVSGSDAPVLIRGETGTGKELVARALHESSARAKGPFVPLNCAAVPPGLLESELFGHVRGAFTDARSARRGLFVEANGGTLFLDEVGEMPLEMQAKLLRVLQERKVRPVGADHEVPYDARLVTATHRDLEQEVAKHNFRQDLYYRINVVRIDVPPLRERGGDVLLLAAHFLARASGRGSKGRLELTGNVAERLLAYDWPGNVRELENCIERAVALARHGHLLVEDLPATLGVSPRVLVEPGLLGGASIRSLEDVERSHILSVIGLAGGNKSRAARLLQLDRRTLLRKLEKYRREGEPNAHR